MKSICFDGLPWLVRVASLASMVLFTSCSDLNQQRLTDPSFDPPPANAKPAGRSERYMDRTGCTVTDERGETIIKTKESLAAGATFISSPTVNTREGCASECCAVKSCNVAVFKRKANTFGCYLFDCGEPSVCTFSAHVGYSVIQLASELDSHADDLASLALLTTTARPTSSVPFAGQPLYGSCQSNQDCSPQQHLECLASYCVCQRGYHPVGSVCREDCSRFQFECANVRDPSMSECIAVYDRCNGIAQCQDGSDEQQCSSSQLPDQSPSASVSGAAPETLPSERPNSERSSSPFVPEDETKLSRVSPANVQVSQQRGGNITRAAFQVAAPRSKGEFRSDDSHARSSQYDAGRSSSLSKEKWNGVVKSDQHKDLSATNPETGFEQEGSPAEEDRELIQLQSSGSRRFPEHESQNISPGEHRERIVAGLDRDSAQIPARTGLSKESDGHRLSGGLSAMKVIVESDKVTLPSKPNRIAVDVEESRKNGANVRLNSGDSVTNLRGQRIDQSMGARGKVLLSGMIEDERLQPLTGKSSVDGTGQSDSDAESDELLKQGSRQQSVVDDNSDTGRYANMQRYRNSWRRLPSDRQTQNGEQGSDVSMSESKNSHVMNRQKSTAVSQPDVKSSPYDGDAPMYESGPLEKPDLTEGSDIGDGRWPVDEKPLSPSGLSGHNRNQQDREGLDLKSAGASHAQAINEPGFKPGDRMSENAGTKFDVKNRNRQPVPMSGGNRGADIPSGGYRDFERSRSRMLGPESSLVTSSHQQAHHAEIGQGVLPSDRTDPDASDEGRRLMKGQQVLSPVRNEPSYVRSQYGDPSSVGRWQSANHFNRLVNTGSQSPSINDESQPAYDGGTGAEPSRYYNDVYSDNVYIPPEDYYYNSGAKQPARSYVDTPDFDYYGNIDSRSPSQSVVPRYRTTRNNTVSDKSGNYRLQSQSEGRFSNVGNGNRMPLSASRQRGLSQNHSVSSPARSSTVTGLQTEPSSRRLSGTTSTVQSTTRSTIVIAMQTTTASTIKVHTTKAALFTVKPPPAEKVANYLSLTAHGISDEARRDAFWSMPGVKGAIVALSLGITFTMLLLLYAGCRYRRLRKMSRRRRPIGSNDADYLINGMYL